MDVKIDKSISIILPLYNEEENIAKVIRKVIEVLKSITDRYEIILVDDGSIDKTPGIIKELQQHNKYTHCVRHDTNLGYGAALASGFHVAQHDLLFFMDADGQFDISEIKHFISFIESYDFVIGCRIKRSDPWYRVFIGNCYSWLIRKLFKLNVKDINCGFKLFKRLVFSVIKIKTTGLLVNAEMLVKAKSAGYSIKEIGITHYPRLKGKQKGLQFKLFPVFLREIIYLYTGKLN